MLCIRDLHVSYGVVLALRGVTLEASKGEIVCVLGPNGAGKSTLMNAISGLVVQDRGEIQLEDTSLGYLPAVQRVRLGVVQCPEGRRLFATLTVGENVRLGAGRQWRRARAELDWLVGLFPVLAERWRQQAGTLSGGEQQMVALARSLIAGPRLLLLDEPALGLAPALVRQVFATLPQVAARGVTILLVEQSARAALKVAGRGYLLRNGRVVMEGSAGVLRTNLEANSGYLGSLEPVLRSPEKGDGSLDQRP